MINYYKWEALISFLGEKERKNTSERQKIKGLFEATTILHNEVHASVYAEKMKIFWLCSKNKFLSLNVLKSRFNHCPDSVIQKCITL